MWPSRYRALLGGLALVVAVAAAAVGVSRASVNGHHAGAPVTDADYLGTSLEGRLALDFRLTDQTGTRVALSDFKGKAVALAFLDPKCTDSCPLTALHYRFTSQALGDRAADVVFLGVNVNKNAGAVADVVEASEKWGINGLKNWHFLTGTEQELRPVWDAYNIVAEGSPKPNKPDERAHTPGVFIIDQTARQRWYISIPFDAGDAWQGPPLSQVLNLRLRELLE